LTQACDRTPPANASAPAILNAWRRGFGDPDVEILRYGDPIGGIELATCDALSIARAKVDDGLVEAFSATRDGIGQRLRRPFRLHAGRLQKSS
jgi:hypothetical protein